MAKYIWSTTQATILTGFKQRRDEIISFLIFDSWRNKEVNINTNVNKIEQITPNITSLHMTILDDNKGRQK